MFLALDSISKPNQNALVDSYGNSITFKELIEVTKDLTSVFGNRDLVFLLSNNEIGSAALYYACLSSKVVPLIIGADISIQQFEDLKETYHPQYICYPFRQQEKWKTYCGDHITSLLDYGIAKTNFKTIQLHSNLALLLSTSGSTGSPKLVRHSYDNIESNAKNVAKIFNINKEDKPIAFLPLQYTMGLSVLTSYLYAGATVYLTDLNLTDKKFWEYLESSQITNFTGVPFSFEILNKLRFFRKNKYPSLNIISQGGGKLSEELYTTIANYCSENQIKFIPTYGQTEATARMCFLPSDKSLAKVCSIGKAIPEGKVYLVNDQRQIVNQTGIAAEMVYEGPNVTMGYARNYFDLSKNDEFKGVLFTGDIAYQDEEGYFFIVGRKKRFLKLYGLRVSLDVVEHSIKNNFKTDVYCTGDDTQLKVIITEEKLLEDVRHYVLEFTKLYHKAVEVVFKEHIPRNESGKVRFNGKA